MWSDFGKWHCGTMRWMLCIRIQFQSKIIFNKLAIASLTKHITSNSTFSISTWLHFGTFFISNGINKFRKFFTFFSILVEHLWKKDKLNKMSRFFATGGSDSESDSDSEREQIVQRPAPAAFTVIYSFNKLLKRKLINCKNLIYSLAMKKKKLNVLCAQRRRSVMKI